MLLVVALLMECSQIEVLEPLVEKCSATLPGVLVVLQMMGLPMMGLEYFELLVLSMEQVLAL